MSAFVNNGDDFPSSSQLEEQQQQNEREIALASKTSKASRKRKVRPEDEDAAENAELDEAERVLTREILWELLLYHRRIPEHDGTIIRTAFGEDTSPSGQTWINARQKMLDMQKNKKKAVLDGMKKLIMKHAEMPAGSLLLDMSIGMTNAALERIAYGAWSPENYYKVWTWSRGLVDFDKSHELGKYYIEWTFKGMALEMCRYLRAEKEKPAEAKTEWDKVHSYYFDLPRKDEFSAVLRRHFFEVPDYQLNQRVQQRLDEEETRRANHQRFNISAPPPSAD